MLPAFTFVEGADLVCDSFRAMKLRGTFVFKLMSAIAILLGTGAPIAAGIADLRCDKLLGALRDSNFIAAAE